jgi:hypothetical protein
MRTGWYPKCHANQYHFALTKLQLLSLEFFRYGDIVISISFMNVPRSIDTGYNMPGSDSKYSQISW